MSRDEVRLRFLGLSSVSGSGSGSGSGAVHCMALDVTDEAQVTPFFERVVSEFGSCDLLVNNAGIAVGGPVEEISGAQFSQVMAVNVTGPFLCAREAFRHMKAAGRGGRIVNVGSISSMSPRPNSAPYTASKFALQGLSQSLSLDGREHGIAVGTIHPGNVYSELLSPEEIERREASEGFIQPADVASCVLQMVRLPPGANVLEMTVIPTRQALVGRG